jgi:hypothetical protein
MLAPAGRDDFDHLSGTAAVVWTLLEAPHSVPELIAELAEMYSASAEAIGPDVMMLVDQLLERGAIDGLEEPRG